jgi:diadenosine tetraphosphate (Ap4A) HIT family hydrolase
MFIRLALDFRSTLTRLESANGKTVAHYEWSFHPRWKGRQFSMASIETWNTYLLSRVF